MDEPLDCRAWKVDGLMPKTANALANSKFSRRICVLISSSSLGFSSVYAQARYFWPENQKNIYSRSKLTKNCVAHLWGFRLRSFTGMTVTELQIKQTNLCPMSWVQIEAQLLTTSTWLKSKWYYDKMVCNGICNYKTNA